MQKKIASFRVQVTGPCHIDLTYFPMDTQYCNLVFESYSYNTAEVRIVWRDWEPVSIPDPNAKSLPDYELIDFEHKQDMLVYTAGLWDQLETKFIFRRLYGYYVLQVSSTNKRMHNTANILLQAYLPTYLSVFYQLGLHFWIDTKALPARNNTWRQLPNGTDFFSWENIIKNLPRVSYVKVSQSEKYSIQNQRKEKHCSGVGHLDVRLRWIHIFYRWWSWLLWALQINLRLNDAGISGSKIRWQCDRKTTEWTPQPSSRGYMTTALRQQQQMQKEQPLIHIAACSTDEHQIQRNVK